MKYETRCFKIKLKPNSIEKVCEWAKTVNERKDEALATLREEEVFLGTVFLDQTNDGDFLISIMKAKNFEKSKKTVNKSVQEIDKFHQKFKMETWEINKRMELLVDLDRISEIK